MLGVGTDAIRQIRSRLKRSQSWRRRGIEGWWRRFDRSIPLRNFESIFSYNTCNSIIKSYPNQPYLTRHIFVTLL
jgi:hypothetical protein